MVSRTIELVCFDLGGVLVECVDGWTEACARAGISSSALLEDPTRRDEMIEASCRFETGEFATEQFVDALGRCINYDRDQVRAVLEAWLIDLYPGVAELLEQLRGRGVATACLTNCNAIHWEQLRDPNSRFAALGTLDHHFASHLTAARKPDPLAFENVEQCLRVPAECILFFDDREENIAGAVWQHWQTQLINPDQDPVHQLDKYLKRHNVL